MKLNSIKTLGLMGFGAVVNAAFVAIAKCFVRYRSVEVFNYCVLGQTRQKLSQLIKNFTKQQYEITPLFEKGDFRHYMSRNKLYIISFLSTPVFRSEKPSLCPFIIEFQFVLRTFVIQTF